LLAACYPDRRIEVWNLGRHGYSSYQGRLLSEQVWEQLRPDVLVFYFGANDAAVAPIRADSAWAKLPRWALRLHRQAYLHSALYRFLRNINLGYLRHRGRRPSATRR
jgi:lysophospholipase L1-like esterase